MISSPNDSSVAALPAGQNAQNPDISQALAGSATAPCSAAARAENREIEIAESVIFVNALHSKYGKKIKKDCENGKKTLMEAILSIAKSYVSAKDKDLATLSSQAL